MKNETESKKVVVVYKEKWLACNGNTVWILLKEEEEEFNHMMFEDKQSNPDYEKNIDIIARVYGDTYQEAFEIAETMSIEKSKVKKQKL